LTEKEERRQKLDWNTTPLGKIDKEEGKALPNPKTRGEENAYKLLPGDFLSKAPPADVQGRVTARSGKERQRANLK